MIKKKYSYIKKKKSIFFRNKKSRFTYYKHIQLNYITNLLKRNKKFAKIYKNQDYFNDIDPNLIVYSPSKYVNNYLKKQIFYKKSLKNFNFKTLFINNNNFKNNNSSLVLRQLIKKPNKFIKSTYFTNFKTSVWKYEPKLVNILPLIIKKTSTLKKKNYKIDKVTLPWITFKNRLQKRIFLIIKNYLRSSHKKRAHNRKIKGALKWMKRRIRRKSKRRKKLNRRIKVIHKQFSNIFYKPYKHLTSKQVFYIHKKNVFDVLNFNYLKDYQKNIQLKQEKSITNVSKKVLNLKFLNLIKTYYKIKINNFALLLFKKNDL